MKTITTTNARKHFRAIIDKVKETGELVAIGRRKSLDALIMKFPKEYNKAIDDITNINAYSSSFDFLAKEPELYSIDDIKKKYAKKHA